MHLKSVHIKMEEKRSKNDPPAVDGQISLADLALTNSESGIESGFVWVIFQQIDVIETWIKRDNAFGWRE